MEISREKLQEITELIEDTVQSFCDTYSTEAYFPRASGPVSGKLAWTIVSCLATAKLAELEEQLAPTNS